MASGSLKILGATGPQRVTTWSTDDPDTVEAARLRFQQEKEIGSLLTRIENGNPVAVEEFDPEATTQVGLRQMTGG
jgi:hypothetical protein